MWESQHKETCEGMHAIHNISLHVCMREWCISLNTELSGRMVLTCVHIHIHVFNHVHEHVYISSWAYVNIYTQFSCACTCTYINAHTHTHMHTHTRIHGHIQAHARKRIYDVHIIRKYWCIWSFACARVHFLMCVRFRYTCTYTCEHNHAHIPRWREICSLRSICRAGVRSDTGICRAWAHMTCILLRLMGLSRWLCRHTRSIFSTSRWRQKLCGSSDSLLSDLYASHVAFEIGPWNETGSKANTRMMLDWNVGDQFSIGQLRMRGALITCFTRNSSLRVYHQGILSQSSGLDRSIRGCCMLLGANISRGEWIALCLWIFLLNLGGYMMVIPILERCRKLLLVSIIQSKCLDFSTIHAYSVLLITKFVEYGPTGHKNREIVILDFFSENSQFASATSRYWLKIVIVRHWRANFMYHFQPSSLCIFGNHERWSLLPSDSDPDPMVSLFSTACVATPEPGPHWVLPKRSTESLYRPKKLQSTIVITELKKLRSFD